MIRSSIVYEVLLPGCELIAVAALSDIATPATPKFAASRCPPNVGLMLSSTRALNAVDNIILPGTLITSTSTLSCAFTLRSLSLPIVL